MCVRKKKAQPGDKVTVKITILVLELVLRILFETGAGGNVPVMSNY